MKIIWTLTLLLAFPAKVLYAQQTQKKESVKEVIKWEKLADARKILKKESAKKLLLSIYTTWCPYCKKMEEETLSHSEVIQYINRNYVAVKIDAETKETLTYGGKKYGYLSKFGVNGLVHYLLDGDISYPCVLSVDKDGKITILKGFMPTQAFLNRLKAAS